MVVKPSVHTWRVSFVLSRETSSRDDKFYNLSADTSMINVNNIFSLSSVPGCSNSDARFISELIHFLQCEAAFCVSERLLMSL